MKKIILFSLFIITQILFSQNGTVDSLNLILKSGVHDTTKCNVLFQLIEAEENDTIWPKYNHLLLEISEKNLKINLSEALKKSFQKSLAGAYGNISYLADRQGNIIEAIKYNEKSLRLFEVINHLEGIASVQNNLGLIYKKQGEYLEAIRCYKSSLVVLRKINNTKLIGPSLTNIGIFYNELKDTINALKFLLEAEKVNLSINNKSGLAKGYLALGLICMEGNNLAKAKQYVEQSQKINEETNNVSALPSSLKGLARLYYLENKFKQSEKLALRAYEISNATNNLEWKRNTSEFLYRIYDKLGDQVNELKYYREYISSRDSLSDLKNKKAAIRNQFKVEFEKKEIELKDLAVQEKLKADAQIKLRNNIIICSIVGVALLILIVFLAFKYYDKMKQIQQDKEIQKAEEQERGRLAQDLHDDLGGTLSALKLNITAKSSSEESTIKILNKAITDLRSISHKLMPLDFENSGINKNLQHYVNTLNAGNLQFNYFFDGNDAVISKDKQLIIYRIILELIHNIIKHSRAKNCTVQGIVFKHNIKFTIEDDGIGFNTSIEHEGIGIKNLKQRIQLLKGTISFDSSTKGTTILFEVPFV